MTTEHEDIPYWCPENGGNGIVGDEIEVLRMRQDRRICGLNTPVQDVLVRSICGAPTELTTTGRPLKSADEREGAMADERYSQKVVSKGALHGDRCSTYMLVKP